MSDRVLQFQKHTQVSFQEIAVSMLLSALCTASAVALMLPVFPHIPGSWGIYALLGAVLSAGICFLLYMPFGRRLPLVLSGAVLLVFAVRFRPFRNGMLVLGNDFQEYLTGRTGRIHLYFQTNGNAGTMLVPSLYLVLLSLIIASLISQRRGAPEKMPGKMNPLRLRMAVPVLLLVLSAVAMILGWPSSPASLLLAAAAAAICAAAGKMQNTAIRGPRWGFLAGAVPICLALVAAGILFLAGHLTAGQDAFQTTDIADAIRHKIHERQFEPAGGSGMPEGDLRCFSTSSENDTTVEEKDAAETAENSESPVPDATPQNENVLMLRITMSHPEKIYLRGFTAEVFENHVWTDSGEKTRIENAALFNTLHENSFYGQKMIASCAENAGSQTKAETIRITYENACRKYRYLPYALAEESLLDPLRIGDAGVLRESADPAEIRYLPGSIPEWYEMGIALAEASENSADIEEYLRLEQAYYGYAMNADRQLPGEAAEECAALFGETPQERSLAEILSLVHETLQNASGYKNSYQYASAAVIMLRYLGVPSRYVEGFLLTAEDANKLAPGQEAVLTSENAHAWAEFYLRGIGWIPFEAMPGYMDNEELSRISVLAEEARKASGGAPLYAQTEIVYTSGIYGTAAPLRPAGQRHFRWKWSYALYFLGAAAAGLLAWFLCKVLAKRRKYQKAMEQIRTARTEGRFRDAVALDFAYASLLMREGGISDVPGEARMRELNEEAVFSSHPLTEENAREAEAFTETVLAACRGKWTRTGRLYRRWIRGII